MIWLISFLLVLAVPAVLPLVHRHLGNASMVYWLLSWLGQTFALPLAIISGVCTVVALTAEQRSVVTLVLGLLAVCLFGLIHFGHHRNGRILLKQVAAELNCDDEVRQALLQYRVPFFTGLLPSKGSDKSVERLKDIAYGEHGERNLLDIYRPKVLPNKPMPVLIHIHGGAWIIGDKYGQALPLLNRMAANGWLCVSINYRLGPDNRFPAMLTDVLHAIEWLKRHAAEYGGDASFIALTGGSAGGHLSALAALVGGQQNKHPDFPQSDTSVQAAMPLYGRYDFLDRTGIWGKYARGLTNFKATKVMSGFPQDCAELWQLASPVEQVTANTPPFFMLHGKDDSFLSVDEGRQMAEALRAHNAELIFAELARGQHAFDIFTTPLTAYFVEAARVVLTQQAVKHNTAV